MGIVMQKNAPFPVCPNCGGEWEYYDGSLGYESLKCNVCNIDINDLLYTTVGDLLSVVKEQEVKDVLRRLSVEICNENKEASL